MDDSIDFILANFSEMNKLWMKYQRNSQKTKECCKHEERQLHILVRMSLVRLSQLESIDVNKYKNVCDCILKPKALLSSLACSTLHDGASDYLSKCPCSGLSDGLYYTGEYCKDYFLSTVKN